jgi:Mu transposase, C-terminal domain
VKGNFIAGRTFHDDADLAEQCVGWLRHVNTERPSDATGQPPVTLLVEEQAKLSALPATAQDYGFFDCVVVSREGLVAIETNRYSVPAHLMGRAVTARIYATRIEVFADHELVATHVRSREQHARIINPAHFEAAFSTKPRARVMVYRDWLCDLAPVVNSYVRELCHKRRAEMKEQMIALYELAQEIGLADFVTALELAAEQQMYSAEYVRAMVSMPTASAPPSSAETNVLALLPSLPVQHEVERDLAQYERYVANRDRVLDAALAATGGQA